ncbi:MAG: hypothetical protein JXR77_15685 [Lentisphaeria bacterium]|nr:hypothetical protein [Lentisphaeria bacterium]
MPEQAWQTDAPTHLRRPIAEPTGEDLGSRLTDFAVSVLNLVDSLPDTLSARHIAEQLLRLSTGPAPLLARAERTSIPRQTIRLLAVALGHLCACRVWLHILRRRADLPPNLVGLILCECEDLIRVLGTEEQMDHGLSTNPSPCTGTPRSPGSTHGPRPASGHPP